MLIGIQGGNGIELATTKEEMDKFLSTYEASIRKDPDLDLTVPYVINGLTQSGLKTTTYVYIREIQFLNIAELPLENQVRVPSLRM